MNMHELENKLLLVDKKCGPTSFDVVEALRKATGIRKVGHTGTLDPLAEGLLLLCTGRATRAAEHFMNLDKRYEFTIRLGVETTTLDAEGEVVREAPCPPIPEREVKAAAKRFVGQYQLDPPAFSALKHNGKRLYELARAGEAPAVKSRAVTVHSLDVTGVDLPEVHLRIRCSRGTYVRSLARDFGRVFDLPAHVGRLVRTGIGAFELESAVSSDLIFAGEVATIRGIQLSDALGFLPGIVIKDESKRALMDGALPGGSDVIETIGPVAKSTTVRILDREGELLAVGNRGGNSAGGLFWVNSFRLFVDRGSVIS